MRKLDTKYDLEKIKKEYEDLVSSIGWDPDAPEHWNSITLQSPNADVYHQDCRADNFYVQDFDAETDYGAENNLYKTLNIPNTWEMSKFIIENNLTRAKLISIAPEFCYKIHRDWTNRIQLAITTDPFCYYMEEGVLYHIPEDGYGYLTETTKDHTAINASKIKRVHLIGCVNELA
jgi:hypothetical protein